MDGIKLSIGAEVSDPMGAVFTVYKKGRNKFFVDFDQYMGDDRSVAMMEMDIYVDFNKNSSYLEIRTLATAPLDVTGMCVQKN